jgi:SNF family Na+-dependent transporter
MPVPSYEHEVSKPWNVSVPKIVVVVSPLVVVVDGVTDWVVKWVERTVEVVISIVVVVTSVTVGVVTTHEQPFDLKELANDLKTGLY